LQPADTFPGLRYTEYAFADESRIFGVFRAHETCLLATICVFFAGGANSVSLNPLTGFEGPLRGGGERKMGKNRGKRKGRNEHGPQEWARGALVPLQMLKSVFLSLKCCILSRRSI